MSVNGGLKNTYVEMRRNVEIVNQTLHSQLSNISIGYTWNHQYMLVQVFCQKFLIWISKYQFHFISLSLSLSLNFQFSEFCENVETRTLHSQQLSNISMGGNTWV